MDVGLLERMDLALIPEPQELEPRAGVFRPQGCLALVVTPDAPDEDRCAAEYLATCLRRDTNLVVEVVDTPASAPCVVQLVRAEGLPQAGYRLTISAKGVEIQGADAAGLYYGTQTLRQCFRKDAEGHYAPCLVIRDWPNLKYRAMHYDTKHHQDTREYVEDFIRELAHYKANVLVWEWEDKLAYQKHPELGAPGAFTLEEMQAFTAYAKTHHVQIVPLVQGLGHVAFILKHPQHKHLRELPDSHWEFCPKKEGSYQLLFDLWDEAIAATPGSEFLHIGSDETYELGLGEACGCKAQAEANGKSSLMQLFIRRCVAHGEKRGRKVLSWAGRLVQGAPDMPPKTMLFVCSSDAKYLKASHEAGYECWVYAPNPGIEPLCLPYFPATSSASMWREDPAREFKGAFRSTAEAISAAGSAKSVDGSITTSWDDSGLHNQMWMPRFVCAAEFSWKTDGRDVETWTRRFFANYFGPQARDLRELFQLLQDAAYFYYDTFERRVWHCGDIGKIHAPDFPGAGLEYHNFFRRRYAQLLNLARNERFRCARALQIIHDNLARNTRRRYDLEVLRSCAELMQHNVALLLMLGNLEEAIGSASLLHFENRQGALKNLVAAEALIVEHLADRKRVFEDLVATWEKTRLPKGLSLPGRPYFFAREKARHFANRTPDMSYLIIDEQLLGLEDYLASLRTYIAAYEKTLGT